MTAATIELSGVSKLYDGRPAVEDFDLTVAAGECLALVGHNGAGKTTLMKLMLGLTRADGGSVRVLGENPGRATAAPVRRRIGFLPENVSFQQAMTGRQVMRFLARLKEEGSAESIRLLDRVGLAEAAGRRIATYSKGMKQRLGLAQALIGAPEVLLLDEPTSGLDPALRLGFYDIVRELKAGGTTVVLSSHALTELEARTDRVAIVGNGRLVACDTLPGLSRAAGLRTCIRVAVPEGKASGVARRIGDGVRVQYVNERAVELICRADAKMSVLREISTLGADVTDVDIMPPTLEQVYAHFLTNGGGR